MKKSFLIMLSGLFILLACIAFPTSASADTTTSASGTTNECKWSLNSGALSLNHWMEKAVNSVTGLTSKVKFLII